MVLGHIGTQENSKLEGILTANFADALKQAGYHVVIEGEQATGDANTNKFDAILEGKIEEFWVDLYMATWHYMKVDLQAVEQDTQNILWEKEIASDEKNVLWLGVQSEFEQVIRESLTKSLNQAAADFASDDFFKRITKD